MSIDEAIRKCECGLRFSDEEYEEFVVMMEELREYRELESQRLLVKLPCKEVYTIIDRNNIKYATIMKRPIDELVLHEIDSIDKGDCRYFSSRDKAEAKLEELRGGID